MELTVVQREILQELINLYREKNRPIKGTEIALRLNRNPGTIRNQMQALRALDLVDGVPGPKGGYVPTSKAYRALGLGDEGEKVVPIYKDGKSGEPELLESAYKNSLKLALEYNINSISFPSLSTGAYGYPIKEAAEIALKTVIEFLKTHGKPQLVRFVLWGESNYKAFEEVLETLLKTYDSLS